MTWPAGEWLRSVEAPALALAAALPLLAVLAVRGAERVSWRRLRALHADEAGGSYALGYLMALPMYLWLLALVIQCGLIFLVKSGTMYAAYAAARSAIVWRTAEPASLRETRVRQAATGAMAPFASSLALPNAASSQAASERYQAALAYLGDLYPADGPGERYFRNKQAYAERATTPTSVETDDLPGGRVAVEVEHAMALHIPGIGLLLGQAAPWSDVKHRVYLVKSKCTLPSEAAFGAGGTLSIPYQSNVR